MDGESDPNSAGPSRVRTRLRTSLWIAGGFGAWLLLLNLGKAPPVPQLEPSWMATITFAAARQLQFGREIVYTFGPFGHLVFSTFSEALFARELIARSLLTVFYVVLLCLVSRPLPRRRRALFLLGALVVSIFSYQSMFMLAIACFGLILCRRSRRHDLLLAPALLFVAIAALIKLTFLWFALLVLAIGAACATAQRRPLRAAAAVAAFAIAFCALWSLAGQDFSGLGAFLRTSVEVTGGYAQTMSVPAQPAVLAAGLGVAVLMLGQFVVLVAPRRSERTDWFVWTILAAALFLAWKLGFCRADGHTVEFFFFAILLALAAPIFLGNARSRFMSVIEGSVVTLVAITGVCAVGPQTPGGLGAALLSTIQQRAQINTRMLLHPTAELARYRAATAQNSNTYDLPRVRQQIGSAPVTVFGYEQGIAIANAFHFIPLPTVQSYCAYNAALAGLNAGLFRSARAPDFALFKMQPIDYHLPAVEDSESFLQLAYDYRPVLAEQGYLLLQRKAERSGPRPQDLPVVQSGELRFGEALPVPAGALWCELEVRPTLLGKVLAFLYQPPVVELKISTGDRQVTRRILRALSTTGFLLNPLLLDEADFVQFSSGQMADVPAVREFAIVKRPGLGRLLHQQVRYRLRTLPAPTAGTPVSGELLGHLRGYTDALATPPVIVRSAVPMERFPLEQRSFLLVHPVGELRFVIPYGTPHATGLFAIKPDAYHATSGVEFEVACTAGAGETTLLRRLLTPKTVPTDRGVQSFRVELPAGADQLILRTLPGPTGSLDWGWSGWSSIRFETTPE